MNDAKVLGLAIGPEEKSDIAIYREARESVTLREGEGIEGDKKCGQTKGRHVNLLARRSYEWFEKNFGRAREMPGGLGENVVVSDDINVAWLDLGQRIQVGEAVIEVVTPRAPCARFTETVEGVMVSHFVGHVGLMCAVVKTGEVKVGDSVSLIS